MTASLTPPVGLPAAGADTGVGNAQNLFEHMASTAKGMPEGASPYQIGQGLMNRLDGFMERSRSFSERTDAISRGDAPTSGQAPSGAQFPTASAPADGANKVAPGQVDQIVSSLGRMFDYSIETQMVVRGATQISGSANTLLKGQ